MKNGSIDQIRIQLFDHHGHELASRAEISLEPDSTIESLLERVKGEFSSLLWCVEPNQLRGFRNAEALKNKDKPLRDRDRVGSVLMLGLQSKAEVLEEVDPIAVVVPMDHSPDLHDLWSQVSMEASVWSLPDVHDLREFLHQELPVKIRVSSSINSIVLCNCDAFRNMSTHNEASPCKEFVRRIEIPLAQFVTSENSEASFISLWNSNIANVLSFALKDATMTRHWNRSTSGMLHWPSFLLKWDSINVFRGEELKPFADLNGGLSHFREQMMWHFGDQVPYLFGYVASGNKIELLALVRSTDFSSNEVDCVRLGNYDLAYSQDRCQLALALLNIARLVPCLAKLCSDSARQEYVEEHRLDGVISHMAPKYVAKDYSQASNSDTKVQHLQQVHDLLTSHHVPNAETLVGLDKEAQVLVFQPRGENCQPCNLLELYDLIVNVLEMLVVLHEAGWMHRWIQWGSIHKRFGSGLRTSWFMSNFDFAAPSPQQSPLDRPLGWTEDPPEMCLAEGDHSTAADLWSVGQLIRTCNLSWDDNETRKAFTDWLMADEPSKRPNASEALLKLKELMEDQFKELLQMPEKKEPKDNASGKKRESGMEDKRLGEHQSMDQEPLNQKRHKATEQEKQTSKVLDLVGSF